MDIDTILKRIKRLTKADKDSTLRSIVEEVGEQALALAVEKQTKHRVLTESVPEETIDIILCCLEMLNHYDWTEAEIKNYAEKKLKKWELSIDKLAGNCFNDEGTV